MSRSRGGRWSCSASLTSLAKTSSPPSTELSPASIRSSVVLPEPLRPDSVRRSRRSSLNETPRKSGSPAMSLARSEAMTTAMASEGRDPRAHGPYRAPHRLDPACERADGPRGRRPGPRRGHLRRDRRQGRDRRRLPAHRRVPAPGLPALDAPAVARPAQGPPQVGREGAPRARRRPRRLVSVAYERSGPAALVTIDRAERRNAVDGATAAALREAFEAFCADDEARVMVLTGAGDAAFSAGADLKALDTLDPGAGGGPLGFTRLASPKPAI